MIRKLTLLSLLVGISLSAAEELDENVPNYTYWDCHPIHVGGQGIWMGEATVEHHDAKTGHILFNRVSAVGSILVPINEKHILAPRVEWAAVTLDWNENPAFHKIHFQYVQFALSYYTTALERWRWITRFDYSLDVDHFDAPGPFGLWSGMVWGTYQLFKDWRYHIGALAYTGMEQYIVYPIIGFDYAPSQKWLIELIFPITYSVQYKVSDHWALALKGRPIKERFRVGPNEPQPFAVTTYSTFGGEFNVRYEYPMRFEAEAFIGYNFGGNFYIKNPGALYNDVKGAPYVGFNVDYGF